MNSLRQKIRAIKGILSGRDYIVIQDTHSYINEEGNLSKGLSVICNSNDKEVMPEEKCLIAAKICRLANEMKESGEENKSIYLDDAESLISKLEEKLKPQYETDTYNWNQIKRAITDSDIKIKI
jgi:hypothetical protein